MIPAYERNGIRLYVGDCREVVPALPEPVSAVVTDPPYGLSFMSKDWDHEVPGETFWRVFSDAMLPGGHLLSFGGSRTFHRISVAIEDAGFEIRDTLMWLYGSGFPKSHDVSKAIDKMAGAEREVVGESPYNARRPNPPASERYKQAGHKANITAPATDAARAWEGWGTALKPSFEPVIMARKPLPGTVAQNVLTHGTGALNIDGCRIEGTVQAGAGSTGFGADREDGYEHGTGRQYTNQGRWPANVILDEHAAAMLDQMSGERKSGGGNRDPNGRPGLRGNHIQPRDDHYIREPSTGGASRFFKVVESDEKAHDSGQFMVQCDCNCETTEGTQWARPDHQASTRAASDTPPKRDTTASTCGTASEAAPSWPTCSCGKSTTDLSPRDTRSTTSTETSRTTASRTCNSLTPSPTSDCTPAANSEMACGGSLARSAENSSRSTESTGTSVKRDGHSTDDADRAISPRSLRINASDESGEPLPRFLYVPKASRAERNRGLPEGSVCSHPTVKPLALLRWLLTLVTPPGGIVLDPFVGSGSTLVACAQLGIPAYGIDMNEEYIEIAARRVDHALNERAQEEAKPRQLSIAD